MKGLLIFGISISLLVAGCKSINHSQIPFCDDINMTGVDCHSPFDINFFGERIDYDYEKAKCKFTTYIGTEERLEFCFRTTENLTKDIEEAFRGCECVCNKT
ncbi:hypothetical protein HY498_05075 [Candidatus Woesearchaeota archaeon]|nr:hypothetical protein [Candidatus Woesearchaeota archaeon]